MESTVPGSQCHEGTQGSMTGGKAASHLPLRFEFHEKSRFAFVTIMLSAMTSCAAWRRSMAFGLRSCVFRPHVEGQKLGGLKSCRAREWN